MSFKGFSIFCSGGHFVQRSGTILAIFGLGSPKKPFCEVILKSNHWPRRTCHLKVVVVVFFYFKLWRPFCLAELYHFSNFVRRSSKKHFCEIILKSSYWHRRRCRLNFFLFLALTAILFS